MNNAQTRIILAFTAGLCVGGGVGFVLAKRHLRAETEKEIAGVKDLYRRLKAEDEEQARADWNPVQDEDAEAEDRYQTPAESLAEAVLDLGYASPESTIIASNRPPREEEGPELYEMEADLRKEVDNMRDIRYIGPSDDDAEDVTRWDRSPNVPYVITEEEFRIDYPHHEKLSITYYEQDEQLADENMAYIPDLEGTVGSANLQYFGLASGDDHVLHIRNERVGADFEVTLDEGSYSRDVLGFGIEQDMVKESKKNVRKMRHRE